MEWLNWQFPCNYIKPRAFCSEVLRRAFHSHIGEPLRTRKQDDILWLTIFPKLKVFYLIPPHVKLSQCLRYWTPIARLFAAIMKSNKSQPSNVFPRADYHEHWWARIRHTLLKLSSQIVEAVWSWQSLLPWKVPIETANEQEDSQIE